MERKREPGLLPFLLEIKVILSKISLALGRHVPSLSRELCTAVLPSLHAGKKTERKKREKEEGGVITVALVASSQDALWNAGSGWTELDRARPSARPQKASFNSSSHF